MATKLLIAAALSLGLGSGLALAQSDTTDSAAGAAPSMDTQLPAGWEGAIGDAFFSDTDAGTLRTEAEVKSGFEGLTPEQQAQVRAHCDTYDTAAADTMDTTDDSLTTGSTTDDPMLSASLEQVCDWVGSM
jgi:hypothetical protein